MQNIKRVLIMSMALVLLWVAPAPGADNLTAEELVVEPPTLICLGFQWYGEGDDNLNATAMVEYRKAGESEWKPAMDMIRVRYKSTPPDDVAPLLAGSIFDLEPGTEYECRLTLKDPDGVEGESQKIVKTSTRAVPTTPGDGEVRHLYPVDHKGEMEEPGYKNLLGAARGLKRGSFGLNNSPTTLKPGDTIVVHGGVYQADRYAYRDSHFLIGFGTYFLHDFQGTPERPITIKAAGDGEVIFDGAGC